MHLYFARHAESLNNSLEGHPDYFTRRSDDPPITERGLKQAACLGALLAGDPEDHARARAHRLYRNPWNHEGFGLTHIYCSRQRRAVETARVVSEATGIPVRLWTDIHECGGVVEYDTDLQEFVGTAGATDAQIREWFPGLLPENGAGPSPTEGWWGGRAMETRSESTERAVRVFRDLLERHGGTDDHVLLVSHSMFYVFFMCVVLGIEFRSELWMTLHNTAVSRLDIGDGDDYEPGMDAGWTRLHGNPVRIAYLNRVDHIPVEILT